MKQIVLSAFAAVLLAFAAAATPVPAQAATIDLLDKNFANKNPGDTTSAVELTPFTLLFSHKFAEFNNTFVDTFKFSITDITKLAFNITTKNHVLSLKFTLLDDQGHSLFTLTGFQANDGETKSTQLTFTGALLDAMLASSFLTLKITGAMCSCASYTISAVTPIPPALLMFLTALGGMGTLVWSRSKRQAVALRAA